MIQEVQLGTLWYLRGVWWGLRWEGGSRSMGYTYNYDGFTLLYGGNEHNIVKTIIFQLKNKWKEWLGFFKTVVGDDPSREVVSEKIWIHSGLRAWEKIISGGDNSKCQGFLGGMSMACLGNRQKTIMAETGKQVVTSGRWGWKGGRNQIMQKLTGHGEALGLIILELWRKALKSF